MVLTAGRLKVISLAALPHTHSATQCYQSYSEAVTNYRDMSREPRAKKQKVLEIYLTSSSSEGSADSQPTQATSNDSKVKSTGNSHEDWSTPVPQRILETVFHTNRHREEWAIWTWVYREIESDGNESNDPTFNGVIDYIDPPFDVSSLTFDNLATPEVYELQWDGVSDLTETDYQQE